MFKKLFKMYSLKIKRAERIKRQCSKLAIEFERYKELYDVRVKCMYDNCNELLLPIVQTALHNAQMEVNEDELARITCNWHEMLKASGFIDKDLNVLLINENALNIVL